MIDVFADIVCPFTHVGLRRLISRRAELGRVDITFHVRSWPLEWVNGEPVDPDFIAHEVDVLRATVAPDLFAGFNPNRFPASSLAALELTAAGYRSSAHVGEGIALELRDLLFERGTDVGDPVVLNDLAAAHGLERPVGFSSVAADYEEGQRRGVLGSPHFFAAGIDAFCPSLKITRPDGDLHVEFDEESFGSFTDRVFPT